MTTVIKVDNLSKKYIIRHEGSERYTALRDVITHSAKNFGSRIINPFSNQSKNNKVEEFWALRDVSFEVKQGERIGIIGRNGAGKSTLLKLLSRITEPSEGRIALKGRVSSLLEVGTGFHPELTGRENIYLNGAILGMSREEINRKFDEIVEFAEVEKFLDTPVKRYSSGMQVRLAFAVASHLEPEILLVDEVLAVGDAQFQKKCLGKMEEVAGEGRTILLVSHNMQALKRICQRGYLLSKGKIATEGVTNIIVQSYLQDSPTASSFKEIERIIHELPSDPNFRLLSIKLFQSNQNIMGIVSSGEPVKIEITYQVLKKTTGLRVYFDLCDTEENLLFRSFHDEQNDSIPTMESGLYTSSATIPANLLSPVNYELRVMATIFNVRTFFPYPGVRIPFSVERTGESNRAYAIDPIRGKISPVLKWTTVKREV